MSADLTCPFCGGPADGFSADHVSLALMAELSERWGKLEEAFFRFEDFVNENFDDLSNEAKERLANEAFALNVRIKGAFGDPEQE